MKHKAFSLLEIMVVVSIMGLLIGIAVPTFNGIRVKQDFLEETTHIADVLADARGNALSSKQCDLLGTDEKVQSRAWAMRVNNEGGGDYTLQILCQEYADNDSSGALDFIPQSATGHDAANDFKRNLSAGGRITRISPLSLPSDLLILDIGPPPSNTRNAGLLLTDKTFDYKKGSYDHPPQRNGAAFSANLDSYTTFDVIFTDLSEEIYILVDGDTADLNKNAADFDPVWYLMIENLELGYEHIDSGGTFIVNPYGICMDNRKGFPQVPCNLIYDES